MAAVASLSNNIPLEQKEVSKTAPRKALFTPWVDALGIGGFAVFFLSVVLLMKLPIDERAHARLLLIFLGFLNWPHFMASYRILYNSKANIRRYPWASLYVPAILLMFAALSLVLWVHNRSFGYALLDYTAAVYLALHYTGQGWGVTAVFARLGGVSMLGVERKLLRLVFHILLLWHLALYHFETKNVPPFLSWMRNFVPSVGQFALASNIAIGVAAIIFWRISRRQGRTVPIRMVLPLASLYLGYMLFAVQGHIGLVVLQLSHAMQYLVLTSRVELNRSAPSRVSPWKHLALYYTVLAAIAWVAFHGIITFGGAVGITLVNLVGLTWVNTINLHHYFVDGCMWKLSNPEVRRDLFLHVSRASNKAGRPKGKRS